MKMKAMIVTNPGPPDVFEKAEVDVPKMRAGHLLVNVKATSINPIDVKIRSKALPFSPEYPAILHVDFAGVVTEVAPDIKHFKIGDEVYGVGGGVKGMFGGALAESLLVDAHLVSLKPSNLSFTEAATLPLVSITAWEALLDKMKIRPGESLLVHGGLGGVGHIAAQLGKQMGAIVHTTVSSDADIAASKELGSDYPINYKTTTVAEYVESYSAGRGFDCIFDTVGGANLVSSFQAARLNGSVACIATGGNHDLTLMYSKGITLHSVLMLIPLITGVNRDHYGKILFEIKKMVEAGKIKPHIHPELFNWSQIGKAHALQESGQNKGKIAISIA